MNRYEVEIQSGLVTASGPVRSPALDQKHHGGQSKIESDDNNTASREVVSGITAGLRRVSGPCLVWAGIR